MRYLSDEKERERVNNCGHGCSGEQKGQGD